MSGPDRTLIFWVEIQSTATLGLGLNGSEQTLSHSIE